MDDKILIYLRLSAGGVVLSRSKVREFKALGNLMADFLRETLAARGGVPADGEIPVLEYVDASDDRVLMRWQTDLARRAYVISGCIPAAYRRRMLDRGESSVSVRSFAERASRDMPDSERDALADRVARSEADLVERIRAAIGADGRFEVELSLPR